MPLPTLSPTPRRRSSGRLRAPRPGFTLIELLVALLLLDVALLAMVGASAVAARQLGEARARGRAAAVATSRLESVVGGPCAGQQNGGSAQVDRGLREAWSISAPVGGVRAVSDTVELTGGAAPARFVFESLAPC